MRELPFDIMSVRLASRLKGEKIFTYEDLKGKTRDECIQIKGLGRTSLRELEELLGEENNIYVPQYHYPRTPSPFFGPNKPKGRRPIPERHMIAFNMRKDAKKYREIGAALSVTTARARQIVIEAEKRIAHRKKYFSE
jgi:hypothetical protein